MQTFDRAQTTPFTAGFPTEPTVGDSAMTTIKNNNDTTNANERSTNSLGLPLGLRYGAPEIKAYIQQSTWRGFAAAVSATALLLGGYMIVINSRSANNTKKVAINKMRLSQLPPPPAQQESTPPPPPPTTIAGPAARAGTPVPVPDALVTPDMKDFASIEDVSRASTTGGDGDDKGFLGLAKDVDVEVREEEPDAYGFISVEQEPYIDLEDLQKRVSRNSAACGHRRESKYPRARFKNRQTKKIYHRILGCRFAEQRCHSSRYERHIHASCPRRATDRLLGQHSYQFPHEIITRSKPH
jgi:hypothetical protein